MVNTIYLLSFVQFIIAIINLRGVSTKLNKYSVQLPITSKACTNDEITIFKVPQTPHAIVGIIS